MDQLQRRCRRHANCREQTNGIINRGNRQTYIIELKIIILDNWPHGQTL